jgi:Leucine-rich repeat (LRR) protein
MAEAITSEILKAKLDEALTQQQQSLALIGYDLSDASPLITLKNYPQLTRLKLNWTNLNDQGLAVVAQLSQLEELQIAGNKITHVGLAHLTHLTQLHLLILKENPAIDNAGLQHLAALPHLQTLHLGGTSVTVEGLESLQTLPQLEALILDEEIIVDKPNEAQLRALLEKLSRTWPKAEIRIKGYGVVSNGHW